MWVGHSDSILMGSKASNSSVWEPDWRSESSTCRAALRDSTAHASSGWQHLCTSLFPAIRNHESPNRVPTRSTSSVAVTPRQANPFLLIAGRGVGLGWAGGERLRHKYVPHADVIVQKSRSNRYNRMFMRATAHQLHRKRAGCQSVPPRVGLMDSWVGPRSQGWINIHWLTRLARHAWWLLAIFIWLPTRSER